MVLRHFSRTRPWKANIHIGIPSKNKTAVFSTNSTCFHAEMGRFEMIL